MDTKKELFILAHYSIKNVGGVIVEIEINRHSKGTCNSDTTCWNVYTRNKLGVSVMIGTVLSNGDLKFTDIIAKAKKELRSKIIKVNNSEFVFESKIYGNSVKAL